MIIKGGIKLFGVAGSGKTTTCQRIMMQLLGYESELPQELKDKINILKIDDLNINDIAFTSFTKASITSIKEKITQNTNIILPPKRECWISTLHSLTWRLAGFEHSNQINENSKDIKKFFDEIHLSYEKDDKGSSEVRIILDIYNNLLSMFSKSLNEIKDNEIEEYLVKVYQKRVFDIFDKMSVESIINYLKRFNKWKDEHDKKDYVDSLIYVLKNKIDIPCKVLIVDEAQDLSYLQTRIIDMWIKDYDKDIFIIAGDDDQTVHEWAGAKPEYLVQFDYNNMIKYKLEYSYRLPENVAVLCNKILKTINYREQKIIFSNKDEGEISYNTHIDMFSLPSFIKEKVKNKETAFLLFRTNKIKDTVANFLFENSNIIFGIIGGQGRYTKRFLSLTNALNKLEQNKILSKEEVYYLFETLPSKTCLIHGVKSKVKDADKKTNYTTKQVMDMTKLWKPQKTLIDFKHEYSQNIKESIIKYIEYEKHNKDKIEVIKKNEMYRNKLNSIKDNIKFYEDEEKKTIHYDIMLSSFHRSKGLEAKHIFVFFGTSDKFKDINDSERRCFYVACSRTEQNLYFMGCNFLLSEKSHLEKEFGNLVNEHITK